MIGIQIKKAFFDGFDNFLGLFLSNAVIAIFILGTGACFTYVSLTDGQRLLIALFVILLLSFYLTGLSALTYNWSLYKNEGIKVFFKTLKEKASHSLLWFSLNALILLTVFVIIPFYGGISSFVGYFVFFLVLWIFILTLLALQYFFPLAMFLPEDKPFKTLKKCYLVFFDNKGITFFLFFRTVFDFTVSIFFASLLPGITGICLSQMDTFKLLFLRYEYLEKHPEMTKKTVKWDDVLVDEKPNVESRNFKKMFKPWK